MSASASAEPQSTSSESQIRPRRPESFQQLAEQVLGDFRESKALQSPDKWGVARDLFERLAGNPLSGELVNEVRLILSEDGNAVRRMTGVKSSSCLLNVLKVPISFGFCHKYDNKSDIMCQIRSLSAPTNHSSTGEDQYRGQHIL